jgi:hypothetical protein
VGSGVKAEAIAEALNRVLEFLVVKGDERAAAVTQHVMMVVAM